MLSTLIPVSMACSLTSIWDYWTSQCLGNSGKACAEADLNPGFLLHGGHGHSVFIIQCWELP